jgi:hypothetical protein
MCTAALQVLFLVGQSSAQTTVTANITTNTTWSSASSPYTLSNDISVTNGATLTIQTGVVVNLKSNAGLSITGTAKLNASNATFINTSSGLGEVSFSDNASGTISGSTFNKVGVYCGGPGNPSLTSNIFTDAGYPIWLNDGSTPIISGSTFTGTTTQAIKLAGAIYRSWTLPNYGLPYYVDGDVYLNVDNAKLKITDGTTVNFIGSSSFTINRYSDTLLANNVTFTRIGTSTPMVGFGGTVPTGSITNSTFNGVYLSITMGSPSVSGNTFNGQNLTTAFYISGPGTAPSISNNTISGVKYPYHINDAALPTFTANNITGATNQGIKLAGAVYASWTLPDYGLPYYVDGDIYLNVDNAKLKITDGTTVNFIGSSSFTINRYSDTLLANNVTFTRIGTSTPMVGFGGTVPTGSITNSTFNGVYLSITMGSPSVSGNTFNGQNLTTAFYISGPGTAPSISNNTMTGVKYPYHINDAALPTFTANNITGATNQGIKLAGAVYASWTLPNYGLPYFVDGDIYLNVDNAKLKITDGTTLNFIGSSSFTINRYSDTLLANNVTFTRIGTSTPMVGFGGTVPTGSITNSTFNGVYLSITMGSPTVSGNTFNGQNLTTAFYISGPGTAPSISNNTMSGVKYPYHINDAALPTFTANNITGATNQGIKLAGAVYASWTLPNYGLPYFVDGDIYLNVDNAKLKITDGTTVNFIGSSSFTINRYSDTLLANNVTFTRIGTSTPMVGFGGTVPTGSITNSTFNGVYLSITMGSPSVSGNTFNGQNLTTAFYISGPGTAPSISNNTMTGVKYPYHINDAALPTFTANNITGATNQGIKLAGAVYASWTLPNYGLPYFVDGDVYLNVDNARLKITDGNTLIFVGSSSFSTNHTGDTLQAQSVSFNSTGYGTPAVVFNDNCIGTLRNCVFTYVQVTCNGTSKDSIIVNTFRGAMDCIVRNNTASVGIVGNNFLVATTNYGVKNLNTSSIVVARNNYWGHSTGPQHSTNPGGVGVKVSDAVDFAGWASVTGIDLTPAAAGLPKEFALNQNYPNPFNPSTVISFELPENCHASLKIFDIGGREVQTVFEDIKSAGRYEVRLNAGNLSSGTYYYRLIAGTHVFTKAMTLLK